MITVRRPKVEWYEITCDTASCGAVLRAHLTEADSVSSSIGEFAEYWVLKCPYCGRYTKFEPEKCAVRT